MIFYKPSQEHTVLRLAEFFRQLNLNLNFIGDCLQCVVGCRLLEGCRACLVQSLTRIGKTMGRLAQCRAHERKANSRQQR